MPQLHFSVDDIVAQRLSARAKEKGLSLSRYLAQVFAKDDLDEWPPGYLDSVVGSCAQSPLEEPEDDRELDDIVLE